MFILLEYRNALPDKHAWHLTHDKYLSIIKFIRRKTCTKNKNLFDEINMIDEIYDICISVFEFGRPRLRGITRNEKVKIVHIKVYWSTESWDLMIDSTSVAFRPVRDCFTHMGSRHFRWRVGLKSISIIYSLGIPCSKHETIIKDLSTIV